MDHLGIKVLLSNSLFCRASISGMNIQWKIDDRCCLIAEVANVTIFQNLSNENTQTLVTKCY